MGGTLFRLSISALPFLIPLLLQIGFGLSPVDAGLLVLAIFAGNLAMKPFTTGLLRRYGFRRVLLVNGLIGVGCILACLGLQQGMPWYGMAVVLFVGGLSRSMQFTTYNAVALPKCPSSRWARRRRYSACASSWRWRWVLRWWHCCCVWR